MEKVLVSNYKDKTDKFSSHSLVIHELGKLDLSNKQVLDIGCDTGVLLNRLKEEVKGLGNYIGADLVNNIEKEFQYIEFIQCNLNSRDLTKFFGNRNFDVVILADILEHLVDPWEALLNLKKFLKPNSNIVISLPNSGHWFFRIKVLFGQIDYMSNGLFDRTHLRFFTKKTAKELILKGGYDVKKLKYSSLPWENLLNSSLLTRTLSVIERALIFLRPQFFAYQFIFIITSKDDLK